MGDSALERAIVVDVETHDPTDEADLLTRFAPFPRKDVYAALNKLLKEENIYLVNGKLSLIPF